ncbi:MAG: hypothetical protein OXE44_04400 [Nitrospinae bacterium]|nr:hypothetical protein [Nitrospinota bacterium]
MSRWKQGVSNFAKTRRALLAGLLGLGLAVLWSGVVFANTGNTEQMGPHAIIDSATDDGGGKIRVSWSLESEPENVTFKKDLPEKVCVYWAVVENGVEGSFTSTCFTSEVSSQEDLVVDTGIGGDGPKTVYSLTVIPYYYGLPLFPEDVNGSMPMTEVTLNASA